MPVRPAAPAAPAGALSPRGLLRLGPGDRDHLPALRLGATLGAPLLLLLLTDRLDLAGFAAFGALSGCYGRHLPLRARVRTQSLAALSLVLAVTAGAAASAVGTAHPDLHPWLVVAGAAAVAGAASLAGEAVGWRPGGPLFQVFGFATCAVAGAPPGTGVGARALLAAGVATACALLAVGLGAAGALLPAGRLGAAAPPLPGRRALSRPTTWTHAARYTAAAGVAGAAATLVGVGHPHWASVAAVVPLSAPTTALRLHRAVHRLAGTAMGLLLAAALLATDPSSGAVVALVVVLQVAVELLVVRNYTLAMVAITPLALLLSHLALPGPAGPLLVDRGVETLLGVVIGVAAALVTRRDRRPAA